MRSLTLLATASVLAIGGLAAHASQAHKISTIAVHAPQSFAAQTKNSIVGTWLASYNGGVVKAIAQWQAGGTSQQSIFFPPKTGNAVLGDWKKNDDGTYSVFLTGWTFDNKGHKLTGHFTKAETETVSGNSYSGMLHVTYYDLDGNIVFEADGTVSADRIGN